MKLALVFEKDDHADDRTTQMLKWFGYTTASVRSAHEAFRVLGSITADVIVIYTVTSAGERRLIPNELKRLVPSSTIILIADDDEDYLMAKHKDFPGVDVVTKRPVSVDAFRRILEPELDRCLPRTRTLPDRERRKR